MAKKLTLKCNGKKIEIIPITNGVKEALTKENTLLKAPGQGAFNLSLPILSLAEICIGDTVTCTATLQGKNISQVFSEVMIVAGNMMVGPIQQEFLPSPKSGEVKGVTHPHWGTENSIEFDVIPCMRLLYCGEGFTLACMTPERYGVPLEAQIWSLEGIYQRGGGEPFRVKLEFDYTGTLVRKTGFYPASVDGIVAPFELLIEDGDTFEPFVTLINDKGEVGAGTVNPIMLGGGNLPHWVQVEACASNYQIGVLVEDFDGKKVRSYSAITVKTH